MGVEGRGGEVVKIQNFKRGSGAERSKKVDHREGHGRKEG